MPRGPFGTDPSDTEGPRGGCGTLVKCIVVEGGGKEKNLGKGKQFFGLWL